VPSRGLGRRFSGVQWEPGLLSGFPAGSPSGPKPWRFAARQIRNLNPGARHAIPEAEASVPQRQDPRPKPRSAWQSKGRNPGSAASQLPGRSPVLPVGSEPKSPSAGGDALTEVPLSAGQVLNRSPVSRLWLLTRRSGTCGHLTKAATKHPQKGKPVASAWRRLRQPPGPLLDRLDCLVGQEAASLGLWLGGSRPLPVDRLGHGRIAVMKPDSRKGESGCG
jgi:hypothetical protein